MLAGCTRRFLVNVTTFCSCALLLMGAKAYQENIPLQPLEKKVMQMWLAGGMALSCLPFNRKRQQQPLASHVPSFIFVSSLINCLAYFFDVSFLFFLCSMRLGRSTECSPQTVAVLWGKGKSSRN